MEGYAVYLQNVDKYYGVKQILMNVNMRVEKGSIYGLLGPSGCGKTTLLSCIVGRRNVDSGRVWVLGGIPNGKTSGIPGPRVGYMPQDIALIGEFTVKAAIYYFAYIFRMSERKIEERYNFLKELLELPPDDRMIKNCSGGQQRRVSFACAMLHEPELLILDEPTVGLDPVMRNSIWNHLVEIAHKNNTAIIITTHYIEEAKQADKIGLLRGGQLLIEESPNKLLEIFCTDSLEKVFLSLSKQHENGILFNQNMEENHITISQNGDCKSTEMLIKSTDVSKNKENKTTNYSISKHRIKALMRKNFLQYFRNMTCLIFNLIFPVMDILVFLLAIGGDVNVNLGIVNTEYSTDICSKYLRHDTAMPYNYVDCDFKYLSCRFLDDLQDKTINKIYYNDLELATEDAKHGKIVGVMYFSDNFTNAFHTRMEKGNKISNETLDLSEIKVWLDMSNRQIGLVLKFKLLDKFLDFQKDLMKDCNISDKLVDMPLNIHHEYGNDKESVINFMAPGILLSIIYFLTTSMTSSIIIQDRLEGVWDRSIVAGVTSIEIVLTHFLTQFMIICWQVIELLIVTFAFYRIEYVSNFPLIAFMVFLQGMGGMVCGFWISVISDNHNMANILTMGMFFPIFLLCGMLWPLESQPPVLRVISKSLPFTAAVVSLRHIMKKGWGIEHLEVLNGIGISLLWIACFIGVSIYLLKKKR